MQEPLTALGFKLRLTKSVKRYIARSFATGQWSETGQGWQGQEGMIQLMGWSRARRIVILRRPLQGDVLLSDEQQLRLASLHRQDAAARRWFLAQLLSHRAVRTPRTRIEVDDLANPQRLAAMPKVAGRPAEVAGARHAAVTAA